VTTKRHTKWQGSWKSWSDPYGRDHYELIRAGRDGIYRQAADGLIIRIAAAEAAHEAEGIARHLLDLAVRYAAGQ
jgi:hypothetical protein